MSDPLDTDFPFTDLSIALRNMEFKGMLLSGTATLEGDEDGFGVTLISLDDGPTLSKCNGGGWVGMAFEDAFFARIAAVIENPRTAIGRMAEAHWRELVADMNSPTSRAIYAAEISGAAR